MEERSGVSSVQTVLWYDDLVPFRDSLHPAGALSHGKSLKGKEGS